MYIHLPLSDCKLSCLVFALHISSLLSFLFRRLRTLICDASAMPYSCCTPRDMNHPITDNSKNNTFYTMLTHISKNIFLLVTSHLVTNFLLYGRLIYDGSPMDRRQPTITWKPARTGKYHNDGSLIVWLLITSM